MGSTTGRQRTRRRARAASITLAGLLLVGACTGGGGDDANSTTTSTSTTPSGGPGGPHPQVLGFEGVRLSQGRGAESVAVTPRADGSPLDAAALDAVLARLPEWDADGDWTTPFNWPAQTRQPPQSGTTTIEQSFPATDAGPDAPEAPTGPLQVLRHQPDGEVDITPFVSLTFDQPMVAVGTVGQLDQAAVPATISPAIEGRWQWIGTTTLRFDAADPAFDRLPMATDYTVTVPAGTTSATGGVLADDVSWTFSTPTPQVQSFQPDDDDSMALEPVFLATFDQRVDAAAVLATVHLTADGDAREIRLATADEIAADDAVQQVVDRVPEGRWIAFRAVEPLPADSAIDVEVGPDLPSAEGPKTSAESTTYSGRTYAALEVERYECSWGSDCPPESGITVTLNNPIDPDRFDPASITLEPAVPGAVIGVSGETITINGTFRPAQEYAITVPASLTDTFGQQLGTADRGTVEIGPARPSIRPLRSPLTTVDPSADPPSISVVSTGHEQLRVIVYAASVDDWPSTQSDPLYEVLYFWGGPAAKVPDLPVLRDTTVDVPGDHDTPTEIAIDLGEFLPDGIGHVVVRVEPVEDYPQDDQDYWSNQPTTTWVQGTNIGLDALGDGDELRAWTTDLGTGAPRGDVAVQVVGTNASATTDADGIARLEHAPTDQTATLLATSGADTALLPDVWQTGSTDAARWYVLDDRGVYRPGETVSVKGWVRRVTAADQQLTRFDGARDIRYVARDPQGVEIGNGTATLNPLGGFDLQIEVPEGASTGTASIEFSLDPAASSGLATTWHEFQIAEFRRPEFEVGARTQSEGPYVRGTALTMAADANYYAGGPLADAPVTWQVTTSSASYSPPGWDDFTFGRWTPWWYAVPGYGVDSYVGPDTCCFPPGGETDVATYTGTTDAAGSQYLDVAVGDLGEDDASLPVTVRAQATVTDVNRQPITATTDVLVHPAQLYAGLHGTRTFVRQGEPLEIEAIVTDIDGEPVAGRDITVTASRSEYAFRDGAWTDVQVDPQACVVTSAAAAVPCSFSTDIGGTYLVEVTVTDDQGRTSRSELTRWVSGAEQIPMRNLELEDLTIVPDGDEYAPGDRAELLVQAPFATGSGLVTVSHGAITSTSRFDLTDGSAIVQVPLAETDVPGVDVSIEVVGSAPRTADDGTELPDAPPRPAFAAGQVQLPVSIASRTLDVAATPQAAELEPGGSTAIDVTVTGADGAPVAGADLAVIVVDEAVLALSGYQLADPLDAFYGALPTQLAATYGRNSIVLVDPAALRDGGRAEGSPDVTVAGSDTTAGELDYSTGGSASTTTAAPAAPAADGADAAREEQAAGSGGAQPNAPIGVRTNFDALAVWAPDVATDADGAARIDVPLPDNLTRYRVMVVAAAGDQQFGSAEANITARLPLAVRPSAPRFLNVGDTFELPVVIQNQSDAPIAADVVVQAANLTPAEATGVRVDVPANDRIEVRFPMSAALAGTGRLRISAVAGAAADSALVELPVYTPATSEAFATYGVVDDGAIVQPVLEPTDVLPQYGSLDITTSSTSLQALTDAVIYLSQYPYESSDARASRILAIVALRDVLDAFDAPGLPSADALNAAVAADIDALAAMQNDDGGFPYWQRGRRSEPYNSVQATHALVAARAAGYAVSDDAVQFALGFLGDIESRIPQEYGPEARDTISAYALNVRALAGQGDPQKAQALYADRGDDLGLDALAWLWPAVEDAAIGEEIARAIGNRAVDTAGSVTFTTDVADDAYVTLASDRRTDGLVLDALIAMQPDSDLIPKVVSGLLAGQRQGRWENVQENSFILLALKHYFDVYESATPEFVARVWLGQQFAGEQPYSGRTTDQHLISIPTAQLQEIGDADLTIAKEGTGRLYYRVGLRTAPASLQLEPLDRGFVVVRTYEAVDDPGDVTQDADGTWHIRAGARVRVRLTMVAESQRTHVALVDPLPAGLEILNPTLATSADVPADPALEEPGDVIWWPWYPTWFDHQNQRDDRAEAFATYLGAGTYDYSYVATATTPGTFVTPPARAEEIYAPETFGRAGTDRVVIG